MDPLMGQQIHGTGTPEQEWRQASCLQDMPRASLAQLIQDSARLVVVAPHPDDEVLGCGGLIAAAQAAGLPVRIVSLTDGELAYPDAPGWAPRLLAPVRRGELEDAVGELGLPVASVVHLGLGDGALSSLQDRIADALGTLLQPGDLVLVTWRRDGHPDHEAAARAAETACNRHAASLLQYPVWAWHWSRPGDGVFEDARALRFDLSADIADAKTRAIARFATQTGQCTPAIANPILPPHVLERFERRFEVFFR
ncbi:PIG-L deacetylase family protein [Xanthomonas sp. 3058]|uniref:PIG-L deacetylase family protein n=1 Tax=Xanthomonas sp. 3058 TaxID=3035314 RepID=UPI0016170CFB|nr:PIG-L deacetylase family protein [Xanthomonas sp. 3058]